MKKKQRETKKSGMDVVESTESTRGWKKYVTKKDDHHECCGRVCDQLPVKLSKELSEPQQQLVVREPESVKYMYWCVKCTGK